MGGRSLAAGKFDEAALLPAVEEQPQPVQIPGQALILRRQLRRGGGDAVLPGARRIEADQPADDAREPAVEHAEQAVLLALDLVAHVVDEFQRSGLQGVAGNQVCRLRHGGP